MIFRFKSTFGNSPMKQELAVRILRKTRDDYNKIALEWDAHRGHIRPMHTRLLAHIPRGARVLDAGCGNGIVYEFFARKSISYVGIDVSAKLIAIARKRARRRNSADKFTFRVGSILNLPFQNKRFSHALCLAVLHHIPNAELRLRAMSELYRVLKPGGELIVNVWNLFADAARSQFYIDEQIKNTRTGFDARDVFIPWRATHGAHIERYIHIFMPEELSMLARTAGFRDVHLYFYDKQTGASVDARTAENITLIAKR